MRKFKPLFGLALWLGLTCNLSSSLAADKPPKFELKDGDRVVLLGGTFIERDQAEGYLETRLTSHYPRANITFRNLGWSGDTVFGLARARFGKQADGFSHLKEHVEALKPTVLLVSYGQNESFEGEAGLDTFRKGLNDLLKVLDGTGARIVFLSPIKHEYLGRPLPDPARHNANIYLYIDALKKVCDERGYGFVDLFQKLDGPFPLTDNGIHLTPSGYWRTAEVIERELGLSTKTPNVTVQADGKVTGESVARVETEAADSGSHRFKLALSHLPGPHAPTTGPTGFETFADHILVHANGVAPGSYELRTDGKRVATASAHDGKLTFKVVAGPDFDQAEKLRGVINAKNELYFHRWRPQNETYLFGFRKHEQGQNAREIPMFDPLVSAKEKEIAQLRQPVAHLYEIKKIEEVNK